MIPFERSAYIMLMDQKIEARKQEKMNKKKMMMKEKEMKGKMKNKMK